MMHHRIRKIRNTRRSRFRWLTRFRRDERGVQLLEMAIVIPILLVLFAAVAEFGRYFYEYTTLAKASRVGARYMISKCVNNSTVDYKANAKRMVVYGNAAGSGSPVLSGLDVNNVDVSYSPAGTAIPDTVTVTIENYPHVPLFNLGALLNNTSLSTAVNVRPSVTMRYLLTSSCS